MPAPGSNKYAQRTNKLRDRLEDEGHRDDEAARLTKRAMADEARPTWPAARNERARGPYGDRTGSGGDPGNVIDLRSPAFSPNDTIPPAYTKTGDNRVPPLEWSGVPDGTAELALVCEDPDAPRGTFLHWLVTGIDPNARSVDDIQGATQWPNDFGDRGYGGPQPPVGDDPHRYVFRLYALKRPLPRDTSDVREALEEDPLATGTLVGTFGR